MNERLLIVDDDPEIRHLLAEFLTGHAFEVETAADGVAMDKALAAGHFDLVILDIMLPGENCLSLCRRLRAQSALPIILLTAISEETDRIIGLEMGADDYLTKPFGPRELLARIRAVLRRTGNQAPVHSAPQGEVLTFAGWHLAPARRELINPGGALVSLTGGEFDLLLALARNPGQILSRDKLLDLTKGRSAAPFDRSVDIQLSRLRRKIEADAKDPQLIKTVRGGGYLFTPEVNHTVEAS
jgi:two-component system OmpR family response regulator